jgi:hypothetical protein
MVVAFLVSSSQAVVWQEVKRLQLIVTYFDHTVMHYPVSMEGGGWKLDSASRWLVVGKGVPRTFIPLDKVRSFEISEF